MNKLVSIIAAGAAMVAAGQASAETPAASPSSVEVGGAAPAICTLPASWSFISGNAGATGVGFAGTTWTIPASAFADSAANPVATPTDYAIRIRGAGFCNTSHRIELRSANGGLVNLASTPAPAGFSNYRPMSYQAHWLGVGTPTGSGTSGILGPRVVVNANLPGSSPSAGADYVVSGTLAPPGARSFDLRLSLPRGAAALPLVAGNYSDSVTVTLSPAG